MAPRQSKRQRESTTGPLEIQIRSWLYNETAVNRFNSMNKSKFFKGAFMKFLDFRGYGIHHIAQRFGFENLIGFEPNNVKIYPLLVKLFYANMNLDHHNPQNKNDCIWTLVCGVKKFSRYNA